MEGDSLKFLLVGLSFRYALSDSSPCPRQDPKTHYTLKVPDLNIPSLPRPYPSDLEDSSCSKTPHALVFWAQNLGDPCAKGPSVTTSHYL